MKTVAVVGCGIISQTHIPVLDSLENVRIKYACDLIIEKAEAMKEKFPAIEQCITDYKIALADPEVDAVYVLTPNSVHYTVTMDALRAGKHVFCEKPITVNYALSKEMADEAAKQNKILNIGVCNRYHRSVEMLADMVKEGKFGNVYHVCCSFRSCRSIPGLGGSYTTKALSGGGVLIDWGIHYLDLILYILGGANIQTTSCNTYSALAKDMQAYNHQGFAMWAEDTSDVVNGTNDVEEFVSGYVRTDKANITFTGAWAQNFEKNENYIDILGDKAGARLAYCGRFTFFNGETLEVEAPEYDIPNMYKCEDAAFIESITTGVHTKNHIENILESAKLLDALYLSADRNAEVRVADEY